MQTYVHERAPDRGDTVKTLLGSTRPCQGRRWLYLQWRAVTKGKKQIESRSLASFSDLVREGPTCESLFNSANESRACWIDLIKYACQYSAASSSMHASIVKPHQVCMPV
jgi:hypothetical protein